VVEVPEEEFDSLGPNVLALAPRVAVALEGNPETRRRMEAAGVDVAVYEGSEISHKGEGGPTCLTRPLLRGGRVGGRGSRRDRGRTNPSHAGRYPRSRARGVAPTEGGTMETFENSVTIRR